MRTLLATAVLLLAGILSLSLHNSDLAFHQDTMSAKPRLASVVYAMQVTGDRLDAYTFYTLATK